MNAHRNHRWRATRRNFTQLERRRRRGMELLAKGLTQAEVARRCDVSETTSFRWKQAWLRKGPTAWKRGRLGRPPKSGGHASDAESRRGVGPSPRRRLIACPPRFPRP
ncbi:MAG: helix-turn-helix domain-containing protein [Verrucomicrobiae bacterium]|nr:helix-turn-helix domain-containing protein [Verrucomicrobiae bacterium]